MLFLAVFLKCSFLRGLLQRWGIVDSRMAEGLCLILHLSWSRATWFLTIEYNTIASVVRPAILQPAGQPAYTRWIDIFFFRYVLLKQVSTINHNFEILTVTISCVQTFHVENPEVARNPTRDLWRQDPEAWAIDDRDDDLGYVPWRCVWCQSNLVGGFKHGWIIFHIFP